jgi:hypothetical protein
MTYDPFEDYSGEYEPPRWTYKCVCTMYAKLGWCKHFRYTVELDVKEEYL